MPKFPEILTNAVSRATGADVELTPLTARELPENAAWRQRFHKQVNRHMQAAPQGESASYYDPSSSFSPDTVVPRKAQVPQKKKRISKWRLIFLIVFMISVAANVTFIVLFVHWYNKYSTFRDLVIQTFTSAPFNGEPVPSPSSQ